MIEVHIHAQRQAIHVEAANADEALYQVDRDDAIALEPAGTGWDAVVWDRDECLIIRQHAGTRTLALNRGVQRYQALMERREIANG
ncbi:hypothetical protein [Salinicola sp. MIT1003]|uniref:hypothetical protein n=1 Tax=Salinicola sp. MIT1003 TaxID=1882734 RepID=UPI0008DCB68F|nr:hypothetical protein [Salinicola sp. MIT1003]OHZ02878.1 hypothetical protein BC443_14340 [Salinicola sp. MIT1003]